MMLRIVCLTLSILATSAPLVAANQLPPESPAQPVVASPMQPGVVVPVPAGRPPTTIQVTPPVESTPPRTRRGQDVNLQVELTITDQTGSAAPEKKTVSLLIADGISGRIRSAGPSATLNIDARPLLVGATDKILLELTVEYSPPAGREPGQLRPANLNESLSVILQSGKPIVISQAADPAMDRKMTVEVRASIMK